MLYHQNFSIKAYNSFGINVQAKYFATFKNVIELEELLQNSIEKLLVLGGGSNILFTKNYDGLVLKNQMQGIKILKEDSVNVWVKAGAGVGWHEFVLFCIDNNFAGVENLSLIPGTVGASPIQNIGAYGVELKDVFYELEAYHLKEKKIVLFNQTDCAFGYRESVFKQKLKNQFVILSVSFKLNKLPTFTTNYEAILTEIEKLGIKELSIKAISDAVISIRQAKLPNPIDIGNAGSFFKNPVISTQLFETIKVNYPQVIAYKINDEKVKLAAGWLIEQCGWKGYRQGDAGCHKKQALVLVNYGNATGNEIAQLSHQIITSVLHKFNVQLETEVNIL